MRNCNERSFSARDRLPHLDFWSKATPIPCGSCGPLFAAWAHAHPREIRMQNAFPLIFPALGVLHSGDRRIHHRRIHHRRTHHRRIHHLADPPPGGLTTRRIHHLANSSPGRLTTRLIHHPADSPPNSCSNSSLNNAFFSL